jgi:hypothetical protein
VTPIFFFFFFFVFFILYYGFFCFCLVGLVIFTQLNKFYTFVNSWISKKHREAILPNHLEDDVAVSVVLFNGSNDGSSNGEDWLGWLDGWLSNNGSITNREDWLSWKGSDFLNGHWLVLSWSGNNWHWVVLLSWLGNNWEWSVLVNWLNSNHWSGDGSISDGEDWLSWLDGWLSNNGSSSNGEDWLSWLDGWLSDNGSVSNGEDWLSWLDGWLSDNGSVSNREDWLSWLD